MGWFVFGALWALVSAIVIDNMIEYDPEEIEIDDTV